MSFNTTGTISEVLIGTGVLYYADRSTANLVFPTDNSGNWENPTTLSVPFSEVGYSEDGWTLEVDKTFEDVMVAEEVDPIKTLKSAQEVRLTGELSQAGIDKLQIAMGGGVKAEDTISALTTQTTGSDFHDGYDSYIPPLSDTFTEYAMVLHTDGPGGADRQFHIPRAVNVGSFAMSHQKAPAKVSLATEFKLLVPDSTINVGTSGGAYYLFRVIDNTNDTDELDIN
jgi:hypothetical protein